MPVTDSLLSSDVPSQPDFEIETKLMRQGKTFVAGIDEVGRGPLAGPVVAAAVVLDPDNLPQGLNDSKKLTEKKREVLFQEILATSHVSWVSLPAAVIDTLNIRGATLSAMALSVQRLPVKPDAALIDGRDVPEPLIKIGTALIKGDARSISIAAASIVAKVVRDRIMIEAADQFPAYGFERHKGYGAKTHMEAIRQHGPCPLHRRSFSPMKEMDQA